MPSETRDLKEAVAKTEREIKLVFDEVLAALLPLGHGGRERVIRSAAVFYGIDLGEDY